MICRAATKSSGAFVALLRSLLVVLLGGRTSNFRGSKTACEANREVRGGRIRQLPNTENKAPPSLAVP